MWPGNGKCHDGDLLKRHRLRDAGLVSGRSGGAGRRDASAGADGQRATLKRAGAAAGAGRRAGRHRRESRRAGCGPARARGAAAA
ncbi:uncharacterized protein BCN122_III0213 [Burkholderia cenocepacia]|nr:uncharacterized protein BCN122_III0213 [Burkholderia cenocepacia]